MIEKVTSRFHAECGTYHVKPAVVVLLMLIPIIAVVLFCALWFIPETYPVARWASKENGPAETITFLALLFGFLFGLRLSARLKARGISVLVWGFMAIFSLAMFLVAMEEVAWGQQFLQFATPESMAQINEQNELTLHNIRGLQGHSEYFHLVFGLAGLISVYFNLHLLNTIRIPRMLAPLFFTIAAVSLYDLLSDQLLAGNYTINYFTRRLSEVNEMLIGLAAFAYPVIVTRKFRTKKAASAPNLVYSTKANSTAVHQPELEAKVLPSTKVTAL